MVQILCDICKHLVPLDDDAARETNENPRCPVCGVEYLLQPEPENVWQPHHWAAGGTGA